MVIRIIERLNASVLHATVVANSCYTVHRFHTVPGKSDVTMPSPAKYAVILSAVYIITRDAQADIFLVEVRSHNRGSVHAKFNVENFAVLYHRVAIVNIRLCIVDMVWNT